MSPDPATAPARPSRRRTGPPPEPPAAAPQAGLHEDVIRALGEAYLAAATNAPDRPHEPAARPGRGRHPRRGVRPADAGRVP